MRARLAAWLVCGPLGHLAAGVVDWVVLLVGWGTLALRARFPSGYSPRGRNPGSTGDAG